MPDRSASYIAEERRVDSLSRCPVYLELLGSFESQDSNQSSVIVVLKSLRITADFCLDGSPTNTRVVTQFISIYMFSGINHDATIPFISDIDKVGRAESLIEIWFLMSGADLNILLVCHILQFPESMLKQSSWKLL